MLIKKEKNCHISWVLKRKYLVKGQGKDNFIDWLVFNVNFSSISTLLNCKGSPSSFFGLSNMVLIKNIFTLQFKISVSWVMGYSVQYDVRLFLNVSTSLTFNNFYGKPRICIVYYTNPWVNYSNLWWSEERSCICKCYLMFVHFWISIFSHLNLIHIRSLDSPFFLITSMAFFKGTYFLCIPYNKKYSICEIK